MASIFLSYDRDDVAKARPIALALENAGHSVWWDLHVRGGAQFSKVIEEALKAADAVVVLWSANSVESAWVRDEAAAGRDSGRLIPVSLDWTKPPLGFRQFQTIDFSTWKGRGRPRGFATLLDSINGADGPRPPAPMTPAGPVKETTPSSRRPWLRFAIPVAVVAAVATLLAIWQPWIGPKGIIVAVRAADQNSGSQALARDLIVQLGSLRTTLPGSFNLVSQSSGSSTRADLLFQATAIPEGGKPGASLVLADKRQNVLWSKKFDSSGISDADLKQQVAFTAARVLGCAVEEASAKYGRLRAGLRQIYLSACASLADVGWDTRSVISMLRQVTDEAPSFRPAWARLLIAETDAIPFANANTLPIDTLRAAIRQDIKSARKLDPEMAEATLAEIYADEGVSLSQSVALLDRAKAQDPENPSVLNHHSFMMISLGRLNQSVDDATRAAELDPLSPAMRTNLIRTLAYAGRIEQARAELARAKQLWPGSTTVRQAEFTLELRYGDFERVLRGPDAVTDPEVELYVKARRDPSEANVAAFRASLRNDSDPAGAVFGLQALGEMDRVAEAYAFVEQPAVTAALKHDTYALFRPWLAKFRRDPRFMRLAQRLGLLDYWRESGRWPDFCSEPDLPYDCKAEAAKLSRA